MAPGRSHSRFGGDREYSPPFDQLNQLPLKNDTLGRWPGSFPTAPAGDAGRRRRIHSAMARLITQAAPESSAWLSSLGGPAIAQFPRQNPPGEVLAEPRHDVDARSFSDQQRIMQFPIL